MLGLRFLCLLLAAQTVSVTSHEIPQNLRGVWVVTQVLPTQTISCWGSQDAHKVLDTTIQYSADSFPMEKFCRPRLLRCG